MKINKIINAILAIIMSISFIKVQTIYANDLGINNIKIKSDFEKIYIGKQFYITKTGKKFHRVNCNCLRKSKIIVNFEDIDHIQILGPCKNCFSKNECDIYEDYYTIIKFNGITS